MNTSTIKSSIFLSFGLAALVFLAWGPPASADGSVSAGDTFMQSGECVTITKVTNGQAYYEFTNGNTSGSGNAPVSYFTESCKTAKAGSITVASDTASGISPDAGPGESSSPASPPTGDFATEMLAAHNCYRAAHGVPALTWNAEMAAYGQKWIDSHGFNHSKSYDSSIGPMGENLAGGGDFSPKQVVAMWYDEIDNPGYPYFGKEPRSSGTGHFTAMIWKDAKFVGCAQSGTTTICNYWSGSPDMNCTVPNMTGCYAEQVQPKKGSVDSCR